MGSWPTSSPSQHSAAIIFCYTAADSIIANPPLANPHPKPSAVLTSLRYKVREGKGEGGVEMYDGTSYQAHDYAPKHLRDGNFPSPPHARRSCCHPFWQQLRPSHDTAAKARPGRCLSHSADDWLRRQGIGGGCRTRALPPSSPEQSTGM